MRLLPALVCALLPLAAQPVVSPEVHADRKVTFRLRAPQAQNVQLDFDGSARTPLTKDAAGVWAVTIGPVAPQIYSYVFAVDGVTVLDPVNERVKPSLMNPRTWVLVPGEPPRPWELQAVARGTLHQHFYDSPLVGDRRYYYVYTPPGFDAKKKYPLLALIHGYTDEASGWSAFGMANVILDNLIAQGKVKPMIVVMPHGYGEPEVVRRGGQGLRDRAAWEKNVTRFVNTLVDEVIPRVEKEYPVSKRREERAVAGLSMGGTESLLSGLAHLDKFAWIGAFSSGGMLENLDAAFPKLSAADNARLKLLWIACGADDRLIESNRKIVAWLKSKQIRHTWVETPGAHTWMVWREYLAQFTPLLFR